MRGPNLRIRTVARLHQLEERTYTALGHICLDKLTSRHIQSFINNLGEEGISTRRAGARAKKLFTVEAVKGNLSPKTIRNYHSFVSSVLGYAVKMGMLRDNPARNVILPLMEHSEKECYTLEEAQHFLESLENVQIGRAHV